MKKITLTLGALTVFALSGCSTIQAVQPTKQDNIPALVGIPLDKRVATSEKKIIEQRDIWYRYKMGIGTEKFDMIAHNTDVDARKNSSRTLPQAYSNMKSKARTDHNEYKIEELKTEIKVVTWQNDSANKLAKNIAESIGYTFVVNKDKDVNVTLNVNDSDLKGVVTALETELEGKANVLIVPENKTFNIIYK